MVVLIVDDRIMTCPYCRKNMIPTREENDVEIRFRCRKCKLTIMVNKKKREDKVMVYE